MTLLRTRNPKRRANSQGGFTLVEVMVALLLLLIGVAGVLSLQMTSVRATSYSRHATEATLLGEDKMEELMSIESGLLANGFDEVNGHGVNDGSADFRRDWTITSAGTAVFVTVQVTWYERGSEQHSISLATERRL